MFKIKLHILFLLIIFSVFSGFSQQVRQLTTYDGLNGRQAFNFAQDKNGFIWISNRFGVDRYDGSNVKNYLLPALNQVKNPVREVHILFDRDSTLWAFTDNGGLYFYNKKSDNFQIFRNLPFYIKCIYFDEEDNIWFGTNNAFGVVRKNKTSIFRNNELNNQLVRRIFKKNEDELLIVSTSSIHYYNKTRHFLKNYFSPSEENQMNAAQIESAYYDTANKQLWIGTVNQGMILFNEKNRTFNKINIGSSLYNPILSIYPYDDSHLFFGTDGLGASLLDKNTLQIVQTFNQQESNLHPLSGNGIYDIFRDKEGRIWMSTYSNGVNIIESKNSGFNTIHHEKNLNNTLYNNIITSILEDADGNIWFGTNDGISVWNRKINQWKHILPGKNVLTVFQDSKRNIWVGTYSQGLFLLTSAGNTVKQFLKQSEGNSIGTNFLYTIFEDSNGNIWSGGIKGILSSYTPSTGEFKQVNISQVNKIIQINPEELLAATVTGLFTISLETNHEKAWNFNTKLKSKYLMDMLFESDSTVWVTSYGGGLNKINLKTGKIKNFTKDNGLASNIVYSILNDENMLWVSTEEGISKINPETGAIANFSTGDGISDKSFRPVSRAKSQSGDLFFGSYNGVTYFQPKEITNLPSKSKIVFLQFSLLNRVTHADEKKSPLKTSINETKRLDLKHSEHSFSLNFTTINFSPNSKPVYMWKLEGLDKDWVGPTTENVVNYTNLKPQKYTFRLKALGNNNEVLDERNIVIAIHQPYWNTLWAKLLGLILLGLILYWAYNYISNYYEKKRASEKIRFFINTTHDLRTPLTLISSPLYELKEKMEDNSWNKYLMDIVTSNLDKMNKMVSQLLDFQKAYEYQEELIISKNNVNELITEKITLWNPVAERKNITLTAELPETNLYEWFDKIKIEKSLDNLISNALKYTQENGKVNVKLTYNQENWNISVSDTGIGIPKSALKNMFQRFYRAENAVNSQETGSGLGLMLIKNYISLHKGRVWAKNNEERGSTFYISLKRGFEHYDKLPVDEKYETEKKENQEDFIGSETADKANIKILIVEDNNDLREYLKLSLGNFYITYSAENGKDAWGKIPTVNPDIVISDFNMPEMNGFELCTQIKQHYETSHIPVIMLTVMNDEKHIQEGIKSGADDYIQKPFDLKYLKLKIDNIINNRKILRSKFLDVNNPETKNVAENDFNNTFLQKAMKIVEDHLTDTHFSISELASEMGMSRSLLYTKFNSITGYNPNDFIKITRMKKAVQLFKEKKYTINEVANLTGFEEASYFTTSFKKIYGKSPKQFINEDL